MNIDFCLLTNKLSYKNINVQKKQGIVYVTITYNKKIITLKVKQ